MTKELLKDYSSKKAEIRELKNILRTLRESDELVGNDVIMDYRTGYPRPQSVIGKDQEKYWSIRNRYIERISKLEEECHEIEIYVEEIKDSRTRRIFRMYCIEGKSQEEIGKVLHMDRSGVSKIINRFIKMAHNSHNSQL